MNLKSTSSEASEKNEEQVVKNGRKTMFIVGRNMAKLCSSVEQKVGILRDEYLAEEISKASVGNVACILLAACSEIWEERNKLGKELLSKKEPTLDDLGNP